MNQQTLSYIIVLGTCCAYPIASAAVAIFAYRRYQIGGWRAVVFGTKGQE